MSKPHPDIKHCAACGRIMEYRPRWAKVWATVRYCSGACRSNPPRADDLALEQSIDRLLRARKVGATICPSEASRDVYGQAGLAPKAMQRARYAAYRMVARGHIEVTQKGNVVDASRAKGPIRLRLSQKGGV